MKQKKKETDTIYWHPAFYAGIQMELQEDADNLDFESEHQLSTKPMQIDVLIIKKENDVPVKKNIGRIFRKRNIIEYKRPDDSLSIDDFYKVYGYTCFYKTDVKYTDSIPLEELTITFVSEGYPRKLIRHLKEVRNYTVIKAESGIYSVKGDIIPIQIIVTGRLPREENLWLRSLTNKLNKPENAQKLIENYIVQKGNNLASSIMETIMRANQKVFQEVNGMSDIFMEIVQEKFDRKLEEKLQEKLEEKLQEKLEEKLQEKLEEKLQEKLEEKLQEKLQEREEALKKKVKEEMKKEAETERITLIWKKCAKNKSLSVIADELETEPEELRSVYNLIIEHPGKNVDEICELVMG